LTSNLRTSALSLKNKVFLFCATSSKQRSRKTVKLSPGSSLSLPGRYANSQTPKRPNRPHIPSFPSMSKSADTKQTARCHLQRTIRLASRYSCNDLRRCFPNPSSAFPRLAVFGEAVFTSAPLKSQEEKQQACDDFSGRPSFAGISGSPAPVMCRDGAELSTKKPRHAPCPARLRPTHGAESGRVRLIPRHG
jgi:hypothetical protein